MITVRPFTGQNIPQLVELVRGYKQESGQKLSQDELKKLEQQFHGIIEDAASNILIAIAHHQVIGYLAYHIIRFPLLLSKECYISDLLVNKDQRGKRVGTQLLQETETIARHHGCCRMMLNNKKKSLAYKRSFYMKHGFIEREEFSNFTKNVA